MAEAIGIASGVAALATLAFQSSKALYQTISSFQSHQQTVLDLLEENGALNVVLESLSKTINSSTRLNLTALEFPLQRCGEACREFGEEIDKLTTLSGGKRAKFLSWAKLRYMGEDVDGFRRLLSGYKDMISVALADATLQMTALTDERIEGYMQLIQRATAGFEDRLERIDGRLESLAEQAAASTEAESSSSGAAAELRQIQEDRVNTERYLGICTQLLAHVNELRPAGRRGRDASSSWSRDVAESVPDKIANEGLDECVDSISRMVYKLATHEKLLFSRLSDAMMGSAAASPSNAAEIARLRSEWESTHKQMDILSKAEVKLKETVSVINNRATGNAIQVMVSVDGKPLHGTNEGTGEWTRQVGGYMSNESLQQVMKGMLQMTLATCDSKTEAKDATPPSEDEESTRRSAFENRHGGGKPLHSAPRAHT